MPGRILQNINKAKSSNPVFILDEIDKVGNDYKGDPSSALLEVLDPEQNTEFHDNFIDQEYDLSKVMFIATANNISTINPALRDRMEMIEISGYITEEKMEIAKRHLIPKEFDNHGIKKYKIKVDDSAVLKIIEDYTRESGVRSLDKQIAKLARRLAKAIGIIDGCGDLTALQKVKTIGSRNQVDTSQYKSSGCIVTLLMVMYILLSRIRIRFRRQH